MISELDTPEVTAAFPMWPVYPMTRRLRVDVVQKRRVDLKIERFWRNRHVQHVFDLPFSTLTPEERLMMDDFFASVRGRMLGNIDFTDPWDGVHYMCRMDVDDQDLEEPSAKRWSGTIRLIEIAGFKTNKPAVPAFPVFASGAVVQYPYRMTRSYRTVVQPQDDNTEKRFEDYAVASGIQRWTVGGEALSGADATALLNAWEGNAGPYRAMTFTEPERGLGYTAHFVETECVHEVVSECASSIRLTLEELK